MPVPPASVVRGGEVILKGSSLASLASVARSSETQAAPPVKATHGARTHKPPASKEPIYVPVVGARGAPPRPVVHRRAGEPRAMHPTASRPAPTLPGAVAMGGVPAVRPPGARPVVPPPRWTPPAPRVAPPK